MLGLDGQVGSLKPGKRADLIAVATDQLNMGLSTDAAHTLVECTQPANVETVVVDGRILKQAGKLTALQPAQIVREARTSLADVRKRANWR